MLPATMYPIPKYKFGFVDDEALAQRVDKVTQLTDIAGVLRGISDVTQITTRTGYQPDMRELTICTGCAKTITITLWADKTKLIDVPSTESACQPSSLIFTSMVVKLFRGEFQFSSTNDTQLYSNIDFKDIADLTSSFTETGGSSVTTIEHHRPMDSSKDEHEVRSTIANMLSDISANDCHGKKYVINGTVLKINTSAGWSYLSCPRCRKTVKHETTYFTCPKCDNAVANPVNRYRLTMEVLDHTGSATVIAFDKDAACLVKRSIDEMIDISKKDNGDEVVEKLFDNLMGSEARFEFRPTNYDIMNHGKTLTVSKISNMHQPFKPLDQQTNIMEAEETKESEVTQPTAESSTAARTRKGQINPHRQ